MLGFGDDRLSIYLNDHLAGATAGVELARRVAGSNRSTSYGPVLERLAEEIEEDRRTLEDIMERLSVRRDRLKVALAWSGEKAGRLKLNGELLRYSPLSRLEELEGLALGVEGKLALWQTLSDTYGDDSRLRGIDFEELIKRARSQRRRLERQRRRAAAAAVR
ncbi:MAG: hypothetical protein ACJ766_05400 [Thermoleophilaceae bacterium]